MCKTRSKKVYPQFKYIASDRCKTVYKQILSNCRYTVQERLKHRHRAHSRVCIKYGTKEFTHNFQELVKRYTDLWLEDHMDHCNTSCTNHRATNSAIKEEMWDKEGSIHVLGITAIA